MFEPIKLDPIAGIREVEITRKANEFLETYFKLYKARYKTNPIQSPDDTQIAKWAVIKLKDNVLDLVAHYLSMPGDEDWFIKQGHSLDCFKKNINRINSHFGITREAWFPKYVVAISEETGTPVLDKNPYRLKGELNQHMKPVLFEDWKKQSFEQKLQLDKLSWPEANLPTWKQNWVEWGYLSNSDT